MPLTIGVDVGGTKIAAGVVDDEGTSLPSCVAKLHPPIRQRLSMLWRVSPRSSRSRTRSRASASARRFHR